MIFIRDITGGIAPWDPAKSEPINVQNISGGYAVITLGDRWLAAYEPDIAAIMFNIFMDWVTEIVNDRENLVFTFPERFFYTRYCSTLFPDGEEIRAAYKKWKTK